MNNENEKGKHCVLDIRRFIGIPAEMSAGIVPIYTEKCQDDPVFSIDSRIPSHAAIGMQPPTEWQL